MLLFFNLIFFANLTAAQMLGLAEGCFESTLPYLNQHKQFGQVISSFQGMQFQISTCAIGC